MSRSHVKPEAVAAKRREILDAAQRLVFTKGYEQMSIQDVLDEVQISSGAFYHYFDSRGAVLEGRCACSTRTRATTRVHSTLPYHPRPYRSDGLPPGSPAEVDAYLAPEYDPVLVRTALHSVMQTRTGAVGKNGAKDSE